MGDIWTAVSRELYNNQLIAVGFIGDNNIHTRVPIENLEQFFNNNNITNIILDTQTGDIQGHGINIDCLDTYKCTPTGRCVFTPGIGEYQILNLASKNISKLKKEKSKLEIARDIQEKRESASRGLAIAATILAVTATGIKGIGKNIEIHTHRDLKQTVYNKLKRYNSLLEQLIEAKRRTNRIIELDSSIIKYSRQLESSNIRSIKLQDDIIEYGVIQYLKNMQVLINVCLGPIIKYNLMDESLREFGAETTLRLYNKSLDNKIHKIKQLQLETKKLVEKNISNKPNNINTQHIEEIEKQIKKLENIINNSIGIQNEIVVRQKLLLMDSIDITSIKVKIETLRDDKLKDEYYDYLYHLENTLLEERQKLSGKLQEFYDRHRESIEKSIEEISLMLQDIKNENYNTKEINGMSTYIVNELNRLHNDIEEVPMNIRESLENKYNKLQDLFEDTKNILNSTHE